MSKDPLDVTNSLYAQNLEYEPDPWSKISPILDVVLGLVLIGGLGIAAYFVTQFI